MWALTSYQVTFLERNTLFKLMFKQGGDENMCNSNLNRKCWFDYKKGYGPDIPSKISDFFLQNIDILNFFPIILTSWLFRLLRYHLFSLKLLKSNNYRLKENIIILFIILFVLSLEWITCILICVVTVTKDLYINYIQIIAITFNKRAKIWTLHAF